MSDKDKMTNQPDSAAKNEAVALSDDDLDEVQGAGLTTFCKMKISRSDEKSLFDHKGNCSYAKSDDIAFIKGETDIKKG